MYGTSVIWPSTRNAPWISILPQPMSKPEGTYLVPAGSSLQRIEDVDREGLRIAVTGGSAYDLFLSRALRHATNCAC